MNPEFRECVICNTSMTFEEPDKKKGLLFACARCQDAFCQSCFIKAHGEEAFGDMFDGTEDEIRCLQCYTKS